MLPCSGMPWSCNNAAISVSAPLRPFAVVWACANLRGSVAALLCAKAYTETFGDFKVGTLGVNALTIALRDFSNMVKCGAC